MDQRRPAFARAFPADEALDRLVSAFATGDFARVRREAPLLAANTSDPRIREAAEQLRTRIEPDPVAKLLLALTALVLLSLASYWLFQRGAGGAPEAPALVR